MQITVHNKITVNKGDFNRNQVSTPDLIAKSNKQEWRTDIDWKKERIMVNQKYLDKAEVLIEALPYIQRFNRKIVVVKYGGSAMLDDELKKNVIKDVVLLKLVGFKPIIVHGGGKEISKWVGKVGKEAEFINGLRVTDAETMEIAEMVLGRVNKSLVQLVESLGVRAIGISGKDGNLLQVEKKLSDGQDIGFVGDVKKVNDRDFV